jgi:hypothetical protein
MNMNVEVWRGRGRPKTIWIDCVGQDNYKRDGCDVSEEMTSDRGEGGRGHAAPTPNELGKGQEEEEVTLRLPSSLINKKQ